ncbi:MAG: hypothetical protein IH991_01885 [Planctomycetes bacterium]|nr:hypothetical protein [Planctomycetota bacterium]
MAAKHSEIYQTLLAECPPATLPDVWQFVEVHPDAHRLPANPQCAIARLREQFSDDELLGSRVTVRRGEELVLHPKLITRDRYVIIVRDQFGGPCSLLTSAGDLHGSVPLFALGQDETVRYALGASDQYLYVAASMEDVVLLRSLGLAAAPATDLDRLNRCELQHLLYLVDGFSDGPISKKRLRTAKYEINHSGRVGAERAEFYVVLVGCELGNGGRVVPEQICAVAHYLARAEQSLDITWDGLYVWWPNEEELEKLDYRRQLEDVALVQDFFREPQPLFGVSDFANPAMLPDREKSFVAVFDELVEAEKTARTEHNSPFLLERLQQIRSDYFRRIDDQLFKPLMETAIESEDLRIRALRMQLAQLTRIFHRAMPRVCAPLVDSVAMSGEVVLPEKACKQIQTLTNETIQLVNAETRIHAKESGSSAPWWPR